MSIWSPLKKKVENPKNDETLSYSITQKLHQNFGCKQTKRQTKRKAVEWVKPAIRNAEKDHGHPLYSFLFFPPLLFLFLSLPRSFLFNYLYHLLFFSHNHTILDKNYQTISAFFLLKFLVGLLRKIAGFLGFAKDDNHESEDKDDGIENLQSYTSPVWAKQLWR